MTQIGAAANQFSLSSETELSPSEFARLAAIAREDAGLALADSKKQMVQSRLTRHLKRSGYATFDDYISSVEENKDSPERQTLINLLTTNVSSFFRESHHFDTLKSQVLPGLIDAARSGRRVRLWSAGCSTGQEPYSLSMQVLSLAPEIAKSDFRILATDIDVDVLRTALAGRYPEREARTLPDGFKAQFVRDVPDDPNTIEIAQPVKDLVSFRQLNLMADWPMQHGFEVILCRNVVIYFDETVQASLWPRFAAALQDGGWLFLGHSERLSTEMQDAFQGAGVTTFRKHQKTRGAA